jgi:hypothetical protein
MGRLLSLGWFAADSTPFPERQLAFVARANCEFGRPDVKAFAANC